MSNNEKEIDYVYRPQKDTPLYILHRGEQIISQWIKVNGKWFKVNGKWFRQTTLEEYL